MTTKKEMLESGKKVLSFWPRMLKYSLIFFSISVGLLILVAIMKIWFIHGMYSFYLCKVISAFGLDLLLSKVIAIFATVVSVLILPWVISFLFLGRRKVELIIVTSIIFSICSLALYYGTGNVFFDRATGKPAKYYIKTLDGFKFSSSVDYDPMFGIEYKPITGDIIKEYYFWQKTGKLGNIPQVQPGKYFDMITGEPIVWYIERADKKIELFSLPGYDPLTGEILKPMTEEVVKKILELRKNKYQERQKKAKVKYSGIDIDKEIFEREVYSLLGYGLNAYTRWAAAGYLNFRGYGITLHKIFFLDRNMIISVFINGWDDNSQFQNYSSVELIDSFGVKHFMSKRFFMVKQKWDYHNDGSLRDFIYINEGERRILFLVFEFMPKKTIKKGSVHFERNKNIDFTIIE